MANKQKEDKLNALLKKNKGSLNYDALKSLKIKDGVIQPAKVKFEYKPSPAKLKGTIPQNKDYYPKAKIYAAVNEPLKKPSLTGPTVKLIPVNDNPSNITPYSPDQADNGLLAADKGLPTTLNGGYIIMNNRIVKPDMYRTAAQRNEVLPQGYKAAYLMNYKKANNNQLVETKNVDDFKARREQITTDFNILLKKIGDDALRTAVGEIADNLTSGDYAGDNIVDKVIRDLPSSLTKMPYDYEAMQSLITGLNATSKKVLILDEIYINAMMTMYLNDFNRKNVRQITFILRPLEYMKNFTDSEGVFSNSLNVTKINNLANFDFVGADFIYVDTTLMKSYTFHILVNLIRSIQAARRESTSCQIVVKTSTNLGKNEQEFYRNMGLDVFTQIFNADVAAEGVTNAEAYNILTGRQSNNELATQANTSLNRTNRSLGDLSSSLAEMEERIKENMSTRDIEKLRTKEKQRQDELDRLNTLINSFESKIGQTKNLIATSERNGEIGEANRYRENLRILEVLRLSKQIELGKLENRDTSRLEYEMKKIEDEKTKKLIKDEQRERERLEEKERVRNLIETPPGRLPPPKFEPEVVQAQPSLQVEETKEYKDVVEKYKKSLRNLLRLLPEQNKAKLIQDGVAAQYINDILVYLNKNSERLTSKYCSILLTDLSMGIKIIPKDKPFEVENIYNELYSLSEKLIGEATKVKSEIGKSLAQKLMNEIYSWHEEYITDVNGLFLNPNITQSPRTPQKPNETMSERLQRLERERREQAVSSRTREKPGGSGIARYIHGGSIQTFITRMNNNINIKNITKPNKSTYVINL